jgi:hypothetical protein
MNDYELPASNRESWWRCTIKETPSPLKYKTESSFVADIIKKPNTYRFKSDGRKHDPPLLVHQSIILVLMILFKIILYII